MRSFWWLILSGVKEDNLTPSFAKGGAAVQSLITHASGGIGTLASDGREGFQKSFSNS
jgi:hypothetical protein